MRDGLCDLRLRAGVAYKIAFAGCPLRRKAARGVIRTIKNRRASLPSPVVVRSHQPRKRLELVIPELCLPAPVLCQHFQNVDPR